VRIIYCMLSFVWLSACASAPASTSFGSESQRALAIVVVPTNQSVNLDILRRVDLAAGSFVDSPVRADVNTFGALENLFTRSNQINARNNTRIVALATLELEPGDYAWVESARTIGNSNWGAGGSVCFHERAPVFHLDAGKISILRFDLIQIRQASFSSAIIEPTTSGMPSDADILAEFQRSRADYPLIVGAAEVLSPSLFVRWEERRPNFLESANRGCVEPATFAVIEGEKQ
jgi:hypothetical protein